jgi:hypothetical protein
MTDAPKQYDVTSRLYAALHPTFNLFIHASLPILIFLPRLLSCILCCLTFLFALLQIFRSFPNLYIYYSLYFSFHPSSKLLPFLFLCLCLFPLFFFLRIYLSFISFALLFHLFLTFLPSLGISLSLFVSLNFTAFVSFISSQGVFLIHKAKFLDPVLRWFNPVDTLILCIFRMS